VAKKVLKCGTGSKLRLAIFGFVGVLCASIAFHFVRELDDKLSNGWIAAYENRNDVSAREIAAKLGRIDPSSEAYYLAHMDISDSVRLSGKSRDAKLSNALRRLENVSYHLPGSNEQMVVMLKAAIAALLGNKALATKYATEGCTMNRAMGLEECLGGPFSFDDPEGSRWMAVQYFERASLYEAVGAGDKTNATFYKAIALKYFDLEQARSLLEVLVHDGRFTDEMGKAYCNPVSPLDASVCDQR
jgi:hypothetical protein